MAISQEFLGMDEYFRSTQGDKIIINDLCYANIRDQDLLMGNMLTVYNAAEAISTKPSCDCGKLNNRYLIGQTCSTCGSTVREPHEKVEPLLWLKVLQSDLKFINVDFWLILRNIMDKKTDWLRWLSDPKYNPPVAVPDFVYGLRDMLGERSYKNTVNRIPDIIMYLYNSPKFKGPDKPEKLESLELLMNMYVLEKDKLYSDYLPIINKKLFVMENTPKGRFTNLAISEIVDVAITWIKHANLNEQIVDEKRNAVSTASIISALADVYYKYFDDYIVKKVGMFRKHVYGARSHFTFRSVITSVPGKHRHDEISIPWGIAVTVFEYHICNKLMKRGFNYKEVNSLLFSCVKMYDPLIHEILLELLAEAPNNRIPVIAQRNPSLLQGSAQLLYITDFKINQEDKTIAISQQIIKSCNGDYDGDELNFTLLLDVFMEEQFKTLAPFYNIPDTSAPYSISGNLTLLSPINSILSNALMDRTEDPANDTVYNLLGKIEITV